MQITFLGTGAATSYPLAFCRCDFCTQARRNGGKDLRRRSSVLINDDLIIDLGPDAIASAFMYNRSIAEIRYVLQTHPHSDHFDASHLATRHPVYGGVDSLSMDIYASPLTLEKMSRLVADEIGTSGFSDPEDLKHMRLRVHPVDQLQSFQVGRYRVTSFPANHDPAVDARLYSVVENGFSMFYGTDTSDLPEETWRGLRSKHLRFDAVILDHTYGSGVPGRTHLNADRFVEHVRRMHAEGLLAPGARILATHLSHEGNPQHAVLSVLARRNGYEIAYDGLVI